MPKNKSLTLLFIVMVVVNKFIRYVKSSSLLNCVGYFTSVSAIYE
jgi:hypothetical protein